MRWPSIIFCWDSRFITYLLHTLWQLKHFWTLSQTLLCEGLNATSTCTILLVSVTNMLVLIVGHFCLHYTCPNICSCSTIAALVGRQISLRYRQPRAVCGCLWVPCFVPTGMGLLVCTSSLVNSFSKVAILQLTLCQHCIS